MTDSGLAARHTASGGGLCLKATCRLTLKSRMFGWLAAAMAACASRVSANVNCMFDCPDTSHTSPTSTSFNSTRFLPLTVRTTGVAFARRESSHTRQRPSAPAVVLFVCPAKLTVTASPGSARPQTGTRTPRCKTIESESTSGSETSARTSAAEASETSSAKREAIT